MKKAKLSSFLSGVLSSVMVFGLATSAMAMSGTISLNTVNLKLNRKEVFTQGDALTNDAGRAIPSSITYTDEGGGGNTYIPLAYVSRLLDTEIFWDGSTGTVKMGYGAVGSGSGNNSGSVTEGPSKGLTDLPLNAAGSVAIPFAEISPVLPGNIKSFSYAIAPTDYTSQEGYEKAVSLHRNNGKYCSITVTNHNDYPLLFTLGRQYNQSADKIYTHIPAGKTVTRTIEIQEREDAITDPKLYVGVSYYDAPKDMHISIDGIQFGK